ncbi:hypothetical protein CDD81_2299 [Ophiocordyceps australis]|uniref:Ubiquitin-conjugating enzyme E2C-binding protein n=1 Tax=Ophiocordyceps australis TaxID=1399860 RepID=A0A2C5XB32_9HYPO|nr:hypothetical protein CDD81_2299 [Ophiocordyceps australis]
MATVIYAELLFNIRQVTVAVSLPSPRDATTAAKIVDEGRRLCLDHDGQSGSLDLPAAVGFDASLGLSEGRLTELVWRLGVANALPRVLDTCAVPWSALHLKAASPVLCKTCRSCLVPPNVVASWKDLPSDNWAEMMEFWHCHKPVNTQSESGHSALANRGYGANATMGAQTGVGLVGTSSFVFAESDCCKLLFACSPIEPRFKASALARDEARATTELLVFCAKCGSQVGSDSSGRPGVTLFKWQVMCEATPPGRAPSGPECLAATMLTAMACSGYAKFTIVPCATHDEPDTDALFIWVLNPHVVYTSTAVQGSRGAVKVFYQDISLARGHRLVEPVTSDVQEISLPAESIDTVRQALVFSNKLLPERERQFKDWTTALLPRWSAEA